MNSTTGFLEAMNAVSLSHYQQGDYSPGALLIKQICWYFIGAPLVSSYWLPWSNFKVAVLRFFGAEIGDQVRIKPGVRIKFPWRLTIGNNVWIGEGAWLDNLAPITIEDDACISQSTYLCTGNHDWNSPTFRLQVAPITIKKMAWIAASAVIAPGVTIGEGTVVGIGSVVTQSLPRMRICAGNPAQIVKSRNIKADIVSLGL
jgi:putative colanic acid biosynthesis acetyltransferase WcaF